MRGSRTVKHASAPVALARDADGAAVRLDEPARQREADPKPAERAIGTLRALDEEIEDPRLHVGGNADAAVRDDEHRFVLHSGHVDVSASRKGLPPSQKDLR